MTRNRVFRSAATALGVVTLAAISAVPAFGDASGAASCVGIEASSISPPGSSDEFPGGMKQLVTETKAAFGTFGPVISGFAKVHAGSHELCDVG
jgi:hypothetical protein